LTFLAVFIVYLFLDVQGNVLVWDTVNKEEHILKYQKKTFSNGVLDVSWTEDSKRICVVGNGKELFGHYPLFFFIY
jgi:hypothetical protein